MQLSLTECRELRDLLLDDTDDSPVPYTSPSSPTALLEAAAASPNTSQISDLNPTDPLTPNTLDLRDKSRVFPPSSINKSAQLFLKLVSNDILSLPLPKITTPNLSKPQQDALRKLKSHDHIIIKEADKGGQVVVLDMAQYKTMCTDIQDNKDWYQPISFSHLDSISIKFNALVDQARDEGTIDNKIWKFIKTPHPRISTFYNLPKLHKKVQKSRADQ